ncbi:MAG: hypothetical protein ABIH21_00975, partial [Patescibacteria group bacterium]
SHQTDILDRRQLCEALLSATGDEGAAHCAKRAKRIFAQRQGYEKLRPTGAIWVEKSARLHNLISLVIFPEGLKFSATSRREISESEVGRYRFSVRYFVITKIFLVMVN